MKRLAILTLLVPGILNAAAVQVAALPPQKPVSGVKNLTCVAIQWTNNQTVTQEKCGALNTAVHDFYNRNSRGKLILKSVVGEVQTGIVGSANNVEVGNKMALAKYPKSDYWILPNVMSKGADHSGDKIAYLNQILDTVAEHETGHLLALGHCTRLDTTGCCDKGSIMNPESKPSSFLTAPQYWFLGWMDKTEWSLWDGKNTTVTLKHPLGAAGELAMTIIPPTVMTKGGHQKFAFLSFPPACDSGKPCVALHLEATTNGPGGTQLIKEVAMGSTFYDAQFTGINMVVSAVPTDISQAKVQLSVK